MIIEVKVLTNAKKNELIKLSDSNYKARITKIPHKGEANKQLIKLIKKEFGVKNQEISIIRGNKGRNKLIEIKNF